MNILENRIAAKFEALDEYLGYLKELQKINKETYLKDYHAYGLAEHYLHLSIEVLLDVARLLIVNFTMPRAEDASQLMNSLFEGGVIPEKLYVQLNGITKFRNVLVHEYDKIDRVTVYHYLQRNLEQFSAFKKAVKSFLKKKKI